MKPTFKNTHLAVEELLREPPAVPVPETPYLGPATVAAVSYKQVELDHPGGRCTARIAVAQSYAPVVGDTVLVISRGTEWYVIGVLEGTGTTTFTAPGDIEFHAPRGRIEMTVRRVWGGGWRFAPTPLCGGAAFGGPACSWWRRLAGGGRGGSWRLG
jgi:hypothetical protein